MYLPKFEIVDGRIVIDEDSLNVQQIETKTDFTSADELHRHKVTSASFRAKKKRKIPDIWSVEDTKLFYKMRLIFFSALSFFVCLFSMQTIAVYGTSFEMIMQAFPGRTRRQIKNEYNQEQKRPRLLDLVLVLFLFLLCLCHVCPITDFLLFRRCNIRECNGDSCIARC